jgi:hypothetical protein
MSPPLNPTEVQSRTDGRATLFNFDQFALPVGRSPDWLKFKNPEAPAVKREAEEDWGKWREEQEPHNL